MAGDGKGREAAATSQGASQPRSSRLLSDKRWDKVKNFKQAPVSIRSALLPWGGWVRVAKIRGMQMSGIEAGVEPRHIQEAEATGIGM